MGRRAFVATVVAALVLAAAAAAARIPRVPALPPGWSHADINVVIGRSAHTLTYDRGRVLGVSGSSLSLREADGTTQTIAVAADARITIAGQPAALAQVRRGEVATTVAIDGGSALSVKVQIPPRLRQGLLRRG
jgi:hypothetical protein